MFSTFSSSNTQEFTPRKGSPTSEARKPVITKFPIHDYELFHDCGCPKAKDCICRYYTDGCGKCSECMKNRMYYRETGIRGTRVCKLALTTDYIKLAKFRIEYPRDILQLRTTLMVQYTHTPRMLFYMRQVFNYAIHRLNQERTIQEKLLSDRSRLLMKVEDPIEMVFLGSQGFMDTDLVHGTRQRVRKEQIIPMVLPLVTESSRAIRRLTAIRNTMLDHWKIYTGAHIVRIVRGHIGRVRAQRKRYAVLSHFAALRIQAVWRGYVDRKYVIPALYDELRNRSARIIQRTWHNFIQDRTFRARTRAKVWRTKVRNAVKIQRIWRGYYVRSRITEIKARAADAKAVFEANRRQRLQAARLRREHIKQHAATTIQRVWRGVVGRRTAYSRRQAGVVSNDRVRELADRFLTTGDLWGFIAAINSDYERVEHEKNREIIRAKAFVDQIIRVRQENTEKAWKAWDRFKHGEDRKRIEGPPAYYTEAVTSVLGSSRPNLLGNGPPVLPGRGGLMGPTVSLGPGMPPVDEYAYKLELLRDMYLKDMPGVGPLKTHLPDQAKPFPAWPTTVPSVYDNSAIRQAQKHAIHEMDAIVRVSKQKSEDKGKKYSSYAEKRYKEALGNINVDPVGGPPVEVSAEYSTGSIDSIMDRALGRRKDAIDEHGRLNTVGGTLPRMPGSLSTVTIGSKRRAYVRGAAISNNASLSAILEPTEEQLPDRIHIHEQRLAGITSLSRQNTSRGSSRHTRTPSQRGLTPMLQRSTPKRSSTLSTPYSTQNGNNLQTNSEYDNLSSYGSVLQEQSTDTFNPYPDPLFSNSSRNATSANNVTGGLSQESNNVVSPYQQKMRDVPDNSFVKKKKAIGSSLSTASVRSTTSSSSLVPSGMLPPSASALAPSLYPLESSSSLSMYDAPVGSRTDETGSKDMKHFQLSIGVTNERNSRSSNRTKGSPRNTTENNGTPRTPKDARKAILLGIPLKNNTDPGIKLHHAPDGSHPLDAYVPKDLITAVETRATVRNEIDDIGLSMKYLGSEYRRLKNDPFSDRVDPTTFAAQQHEEKKDEENLLDGDDDEEDNEMNHPPTHTEEENTGTESEAGNRSVSSSRQSPRSALRPGSRGILSRPGTRSAGRKPGTPSVQITEPFVKLSAVHHHTPSRNVTTTKVRPLTESSEILLNSLEQPLLVIPKRTFVSVADVKADLAGNGIKELGLLLSRRTTNRLILDSQKIGWGKWSNKGASGVRNVLRRKSLDLTDGFVTVDYQALQAPLDRYHGKTKRRNSATVRPSSAPSSKRDANQTASSPRHMATIRFASPTSPSSPGNNKATENGNGNEVATVSNEEIKAGIRPDTAPAQVLKWRYTPIPLEQRSIEQQKLLREHAEKRAAQKNLKAGTYATIDGSGGFGMSMVVDTADARVAAHDSMATEEKRAKAVEDAIARARIEEAKRRGISITAEESRMSEEEKLRVQQLLSSSESGTMDHLVAPYDDGFRDADERREAMETKRRLVEFSKPYEREAAQRVSHSFVHALITTVAANVERIAVNKRNEDRSQLVQERQNRTLDPLPASVKPRDVAPAILYNGVGMVNGFSNEMEIGKSLIMLEDIYRMTGIKTDIADEALEYATTGTNDPTKSAVPLGLDGAPMSRLEALQFRVDPTYRHQRRNSRTSMNSTTQHSSSLHADKTLNRPQHEEKKDDPNDNSQSFVIPPISSTNVTHLPGLLASDGRIVSDTGYDTTALAADVMKSLGAQAAVVTRRPKNAPGSSSEHNDNGNLSTSNNPDMINLPSVSLAPIEEEDDHYPVDQNNATPHSNKSSPQSVNQSAKILSTSDNRKPGRASRPSSSPRDSLLESEEDEFGNPIKPSQRYNLNRPSPISTPDNETNLQNSFDNDDVDSELQRETVGLVDPGKPVGKAIKALVNPKLGYNPNDTLRMAPLQQATGIFAEEATLQAHGLGIPGVRALLVDIRGIDGPFDMLVYHAVLRVLPVPPAAIEEAREQGILTMQEYQQLRRISATLTEEEQAEEDTAANRAAALDDNYPTAKLDEEFSIRSNSPPRNNNSSSRGRRLSTGTNQSVRSGSTSRSPSRQRAPSTSPHASRSVSRQSSRSNSRAGSRGRHPSNDPNPHESHKESEKKLWSQLDTHNQQGRKIVRGGVDPKKNKDAKSINKMDAEGAGELAAHVLRELAPSLARVQWERMLHENSFPIVATLRSKEIRFVGDLLKIELASFGINPSVISVMKRLLGVIVAATKLTTPSGIKALYQLKPKTLSAAAVTGPTYDHSLLKELSPAPLTVPTSGPSSTVRKTKGVLSSSRSSHRPGSMNRSSTTVPITTKESHRTTNDESIFSQVSTAASSRAGTANSRKEYTTQVNSVRGAINRRSKSTLRESIHEEREEMNQSRNSIHPGERLPKGAAGLGSPMGVLHLLDDSSTTSASSPHGLWQSSLLLQSPSGAANEIQIRSHSPSNSPTTVKNNNSQRPGSTSKGKNSSASVKTSVKSIPTGSPSASMNSIRTMPRIQTPNATHRPGVFLEDVNDSVTYTQSNLFLPFAGKLRIPALDLANGGTAYPGNVPDTLILPSGFSVLRRDPAMTSAAIGTRIIEKEEKIEAEEAAKRAEEITNRRERMKKQKYFTNDLETAYGGRSGANVTVSGHLTDVHGRVISDTATASSALNSYIENANHNRPSRDSRLRTLSTVLEDRMSIVLDVMAASLDGVSAVAGLDEPLDVAMIQCAFLLPLPAPRLVEMSDVRTNTRRVSDKEKNCAIVPYDVFLRQLCIVPPILDILTEGLRSWVKERPVTPNRTGSRGSSRGGGRHHNVHMEPFTEAEIRENTEGALEQLTIKSKPKMLIQERARAAQIVARPWITALAKSGFTRMGQLVRIPPRDLEIALKAAYPVLIPPGSTQFEQACYQLADIIPAFGVALLLESVIEYWVQVNPSLRLEVHRMSGAYDSRYMRSPTDPVRSGARVSAKEVYYEQAMQRAAKFTGHNARTGAEFPLSIGSIVPVSTNDGRPRFGAPGVRLASTALSMERVASGHLPIPTPLMQVAASSTRVAPTPPVNGSVLSSMSMFSPMQSVPEDHSSPYPSTTSPSMQRILSQRNNQVAHVLGHNHHNNNNNLHLGPHQSIASMDNLSVPSMEAFVAANNTTTNTMNQRHRSMYGDGDGDDDTLGTASQAPSEPPDFLSFGLGANIVGTKDPHYKPLTPYRALAEAKSGKRRFVTSRQGGPRSRHDTNTPPTEKSPSSRFFPDDTSRGFAWMPPTGPSLPKAII